MAPAWTHSPLPFLHCSYALCPEFFSKRVVQSAEKKMNMWRRRRPRPQGISRKLYTSSGKRLVFLLPNPSRSASFPSPGSAPIRRGYLARQLDAARVSITLLLGHCRGGGFLFETGTSKFRRISGAGLFVVEILCIEGVAKIGTPLSK